MTAREALREYIDRLSDDEVETLWHRIQCEDKFPPEPLTPSELAEVERALEASREGRSVSLAEARRRFGLER
jgi:hypothetical protein